MLISGNGSMSGSGEHCGMGVLLLDHWDNRKTPETQVGAIIAEIRKRTADVYAAKVTCFTTPAISGLGRLGGVGFNLCSDAGADATALATAAQAFVRRIQELPEAGRVTCGFRADTPQLRLTLDRQKAKSLGVDPSTVFSTLQNKLASVYVNDFNKDGRAYEVLVQSQADFRATPEDIADLHVPAANGAMVPLSAIGTVAYEIGSREVTRFNKMPSASINAQVAPGVAPLELISAIERAGAPEGYHVEWSEMSLQEKENQGRLGLLMGLAALFAYLFLVAQYESWTIPLPVMCSVVFALAGAYLGLGPVDHRHADEHLRAAWSRDADRAFREERDSHGGVLETAARGGGAARRRRGVEGGGSSLPRRTDDGVELPLRRAAARSRDGRGCRLAEGDRHLHVLGDACRHVRGHLLHPCALRAVPAPSRVGEESCPACLTPLVLSR